MPNKEKKVQVQFNSRQKSLFKRKEKKEKPLSQGQKKLKKKKEERKKNKSASKVKNEKFSVFDSCKSSLDVIYLTCALCTKVYHFSCAHPLSNFGDNVSSLTYVCHGCAHNNSTVFHHFLLSGATHKATFKDTFIRDRFELWYNLQ